MAGEFGTPPGGRVYVQQPPQQAVQPVADVTLPPAVVTTSQFLRRFDDLTQNDKLSGDESEQDEDDEMAAPAAKARKGPKRNGSTTRQTAGKPGRPPKRFKSETPDEPVRFMPRNKHGRRNFKVNKASEALDSSFGKPPPHLPQAARVDRMQHARNIEFVLFSPAPSCFSRTDRHTPQRKPPEKKTTKMRPRRTVADITS